MEIAPLCHALIQNILSPVADHKILLEDPQQMSLLVAVVRVQKQGQISLNIFLVKGDPVCHDPLVHRINIKQMELVSAVAVTGHRDIVQAGVYGQIAELHRIAHIPAGQPTVLLDPRVYGLLLQIVLKLLLKQPQVIVQSDAVPVQPQSGDGVQKTRRQAPQASVSKGRLRLRLLNLGQMLSGLLQLLLHLVIHPQIDQVVGQQFPDQELCRDVVQLLLSLAALLLLRRLLGHVQTRVIQLPVRTLADILIV